VIVRALAGFVLAGALAFGARATRSLSPSGAVAALVIGTTAAIAGWSWAIILIAFFIASSALSRYRRTARENLIGRIVEKGDERDAYQVFANGGVFTICVAIAAATGSHVWATAAIGALAAAAADTWATEIGTIFGGTARSIISFEPLPPGTSGGVTLAGTLATVVGSAAVTAVAVAVGVGSSAFAMFVGGVVGSLSDSVVGATIQERRWCDRCSEATERRVHVCGEMTRVVGGIPGARNDFVNVVCSVVGAAVAAGIGAFAV
jgi:uncharacterized protein (TIGR00297 family)